MMFGRRSHAPSFAPQSSAALEIEHVDARARTGERAQPASDTRRTAATLAQPAQPAHPAATSAAAAAVPPSASRRPR